MKIIISPTLKSPKNLRSLKRVLRRNGIPTEPEIEKLPNGHLGRGIVSGLATVLTGSDGFFSKLGEAIVKYVELKKVDVSIKNEKGEEISLSAAIPKDEIRVMVNEFLGRDITSVKVNKKQIAKKK